MSLQIIILPLRSGCKIFTRLLTYFIVHIPSFPEASIRFLTLGAAYSWLDPDPARRRKNLPMLASKNAEVKISPARSYSALSLPIYLLIKTAVFLTNRVLAT